MAITSYSELQTAMNNWSERSDSVSRLQEAIALAEGRLNRLLDPVQTDQSLTGVVDSREIDISSYSVDRPLALFITETSGDEKGLSQKAPDEMPYATTSGRPVAWTVKTQATIELDRPCDSAYTFRLVFDQRFALSDSATTNWLLANHPDCYFAAAMMWGAGYNENTQMGAVWKGILDESIPEIRHQIAQFKRGSLRVDPALLVANRVYNINSDVA